MDWTTRKEVENADMYGMVLGADRRQPRKAADERRQAQRMVDGPHKPQTTARDRHSQE